MEVTLERTDEEAQEFLRVSRFHWHQRFRLSPGVLTPGVNDVEWLLEQVALPAGGIRGRSVLDVGTTNGGAAFVLERMGASRVVATDLAPLDRYGAHELRRFLGSSVEFVQAGLYDLPEVLRETFDIVVFWGVLYHLRHPLLGLDAIRRLSRGQVWLETHVADSLLADPACRCALFFRRSELAGDPSNWFSPTLSCLRDWMASSGFEIIRQEAWPEKKPSRAMMSARVVPGPPEFQHIGFEMPLSAKPILE